MKISKLGLLAALVLGGLVAGSTLATAQDAAPPAGKGKRGGMGVEQQLERMTTELKLTEAQVPKVKAVLEEGTKLRTELRDATPEERREKMTAFRESQDKKMKEILTPEQNEKWIKLRDEMRNKKGGPGGGAPGAAAGEKKADAKKN